MVEDIEKDLYLINSGPSTVGNGMWPPFVVYELSD